MVEYLASEQQKRMTQDICEKCEAVLTMPDDPTQKPNHECGVLDAIANDYDWKEAFAFASGEWVTGSGKDTLPAEPFTREDVVEIIAKDEGENDGPDWIMLGKLRNGRYFFLSAGCDYTGWDCQAGGRAYIADTVEQLTQFAMNPDDRTRMQRNGYLLAASA